MALATLSVDLIARLANLETNLSKAVRLAEKDSARMERAFSRVAGVAAGIGGAIAAALSVREITDWIKGSIDAADAAAKQARTVGLLTEEITALNYAADLSGVSQDELTTALVKLSKTAFDADSGLKAAADTFTQLGIKVRDTDGKLKGSGKLLEEIADKYQSLPAGIDKTALATELFGRAGAKMISLLDGGSDGLRKMRDEAERLGLVIGSDTAAQAEAFNDNLTRLQRNVEGIGISIANKLLPTLAKLSERLVQNAQDAGIARGAFITLFESMFGSLDPLDAAGEKVAKLGKEIENLQSLQATISNQDSAEARSIAEQIDAKVKQLEAAQKAVKQLSSEVLPPSVKAVTSIASIPEKAKKSKAEKGDFVGPEIPAALADALKSLEQTDTAKITELRDRLGELLNLQRAGIGGEATAEAIRKTREELDKFDPLAQSAAKRLEELQQAGAASFDATRTPAERLNVELAKQNAILEALGPAYRDTYERAVFAAQDAYDEAVKVNKELDKTNDFAKEVGLTFTSAFEDAIVGGKGLRDILKGIEQDLLRIFTRKLVTEPLGNALTGLIGGGGKGGGGFDLGKIASGLFGKLLGGLGLPSFDVGTPYVPRDMVAMVHKGERIVPAAQNAAGGGGMRVTNVFHLSGPVDRRTQQQIAAAAARGVEAASRRLN